MLGNWFLTHPSVEFFIVVVVKLLHIVSLLLYAVLALFFHGHLCSLSSNPFVGGTVSHTVCLSKVFLCLDSFNLWIKSLRFLKKLTIEHHFQIIHIYMPLVCTQFYCIVDGPDALIS